MSQLALATEADVSARHVSFVETGRAKPSREMIVRLAEVLDVPLRERNALLLAAGFAPLYREATLDAPELAPVRAALDLMLDHAEPYPAVVMNRRWDILRANGAARRFFGMLLGAPVPNPAGNLLDRIFDPKALRPWIANWDEVAEALVHRTRRESIGAARDPEIDELLRRVLAYPGVPARVRSPNLAAPLLPVIPIRFEKEGRVYAYFSAVTTLGSPQDITAQEVRLESLFPVDATTAKLARALVPSE